MVQAYTSHQRRQSIVGAMLHIYVAVSMEPLAIQVLGTCKAPRVLDSTGLQPTVDDESKGLRQR